jgi:gliding motility-associated-like protein
MKVEDKKMKGVIGKYSFMIILMLTSIGINHSAYAQLSFELPSKSNQRLLSYSAIRVNVSGKLALCSHSERGNIILDVTGGIPPYSFKWNNHQTVQNRTNLLAGTYTVWITDATGTVHTENIVIQPPFPLILNPLEKKDASCGSSSDGYAKIGVKIGRGEPYKISWSHGLKDKWEASNLKPGAYTVVVTDIYNCDVSISFEIKSPIEGISASASIADKSCSGTNDGNIILNVTGGVSPYTYKWSNGATTKDISNLNAGTYEVQILDSKGCSFQGIYTVKEPVGMSLSFSATEPTCTGSETGKLEVKVTGGKSPYTYLWNTGQTSSTLDNMAAGTYKVTVTDAVGCKSEKEIVLKNASTLEMKLLETKSISCSGASDGKATVELKGIKGLFNIQWSDGISNTLSRNDLKSGSYSVTAKDESGCQVSLSFTIDAIAQINARIESALDVNCKAGSVSGLAWVSIQGGKEPYKISWSTGVVDQREITFSNSGNIKVKVTDALGCTVESETQVTFPGTSSQNSRLGFNYRRLSISNEPEVLVEEEILFESEISPEFMAWEWTFGDGNKSNEKDPVHKYAKAGTYEVTLTGFDLFGCSSVERNQVLVSSPQPFLIVPSAFTPNGDGLNDTFIPVFKSLNSFSMEVFNTWGERIFYANSLETKGWDGTHKGQFSAPGNYLYKITYTTLEGLTSIRTGGVTLIR